jgi:hypothetical protein
MRKRNKTAVVSIMWRILRPTNKKGWTHRGRIRHSGVTENERHESLPLDGPMENEGPPRWVKGMKFDIDFTDIWWTSLHTAETSCKVVIFEFTNQNVQQSFSHRHWIWLDYEQQSEISNLWLFEGESDHDLNTRIIKYFLIFPTVTCTPWYDFSKLTRPLKSCSGQNWAFWEFWTFDPNSNVISQNFQYQHCSYLFKFSDGY